MQMPRTLCCFAPDFAGTTVRKSLRSRTFADGVKSQPLTNAGELAQQDYTFVCSVISPTVNNSLRQAMWVSVQLPVVQLLISRLSWRRLFWRRGKGRSCDVSDVISRMNSNQTIALIPLGNIFVVLWRVFSTVQFVQYCGGYHNC